MYLKWPIGVHVPEDVQYLGNDRCGEVLKLLRPGCSSPPGQSECTVGGNRLSRNGTRSCLVKLVLGLWRLRLIRVLNWKAMRLHMQTVDSSFFAGFVDRRFLASRFSSCMLPFRTPHTSKVNGLMMVMVPVTHRVGNDLLSRASSPWRQKAPLWQRRGQLEQPCKWAKQ